MSEFLLKEQCIIEAKAARAIGKKGLEVKTRELITQFFNDICRVVLAGDEDVFLIQWGVMRLTDDEKDAINDMENNTERSN